jgi:hypothetical protein
VEGIQQPDDNNLTTWRINRNAPDFLEAVHDKYKKTKYNELRRKMFIKFEGEEGIDRGALTKDFFYICFKRVNNDRYKDCHMMTGEPGHLIPESTAEHLVDGYKFVGMMIAHAVRNGCRGLPGLSPAIKHYLIFGEGPAFIEELAPPVCFDDVADAGLRGLLTKVSLEGG